jgi:signal transduction histidine kinase
MPLAERLRRLSGTSAFRFAALSAFVFLLAALGTTLLSSRLIERLLMEHVRDMLLSDIQEHERNARLEDAGALAGILRLRPSSDERIVLVEDARGNLILGEPALLQVLGEGAGPGWNRLRVIGEDGQPMIVVGMQTDLADGGWLFSAFNIQPMLTRVRAIPLMAGGGLFVVLLGSLGMGLYASLRSMRRVDQMRAGLHAYVGGERERRLAVSPAGDEYDLLSQDINHMLERIHLLMDEVRSASSHLAHELRTPLTRLQHQLTEVAGIGDANVQVRMAAALQETARIQRLFKSVLRISEVEAGRCPHAFSWVDASSLLQDVSEYYQPLAEQLGIALEVVSPPGFRLWGDRALLFQALANLLENAFKYAPGSERIVLQAGVCEGMSSVGVADQGPGIPPAQRALALQRFRRLQTEGPEGYGLGLSLVSAIARLHAGRLCLLENTPAGLLARLQLPMR